MERESNPMQPQCRSGCGFYGNPAQDGLCSVCYKDSLRKKQTPPVNSTPVSVPSPQNTPTFSPAITITNTAKPTVQSLHQHNDLIKEVMSNDRLFQRKIAAAPSRPPKKIVEHFEPKGCETGRKLNEDAVNKDNLVSAAGPSTSTNNEQDEDKDDGDKDGKKKKNRCATCRKKVGLTGFECRCGGLYCAVHRYSDKHNCTFDYREHGAQEIRRNNPVVVGEKIQKI